MKKVTWKVWLNILKRKTSSQSILLFGLRNLSSQYSIGLWGRSMGAVTSILYASKDHNIACMCLDSAFSNLTQLCMETLKGRVISPNILRNSDSDFCRHWDHSSVGCLWALYEKLSRKKPTSNLSNIIFAWEFPKSFSSEVSPIDCVSHCKMPALFIHGRKDTIVSISHSQKLFSVIFP